MHVLQHYAQLTVLCTSYSCKLVSRRQYRLLVLGALADLHQRNTLLEVFLVRSMWGVWYLHGAVGVELPIMQARLACFSIQIETTTQVL